MAGLQAWLFLTVHPAPVLLIHSVAVILMALATYAVVIAPTAVSSVVGVLAVGTVLWTWASVPDPILAIDALAGVLVLVLAGWQQHRRRKRLHRLAQILEDFDEECYLKDQTTHLTRHTHEALARKLGRYEQLQAVAESLSRLVNLDAIARLAVNRVFELIGKSDACLLFLIDRERQELSLFASKRAPAVPVIRSKHGDQFDRYALRTQRPLLVNDVRRDFRFSVAADLDRPVGSVIACPLLVGESAEGVLRLDCAQANAYTQEDLRFLDILLGLVDTAIANARLFAQTQQLAMTDGLTGLYRRQPFLDHLSRELARAGRRDESFAVLMFDLDHFKRYNDTFGHPAGDLVLKTVAELMRQTTGPDGMCARYGGEEFAVVVPRVSRKQAQELAERIRRTVETQVRKAGQGSDHPMTISGGVSMFPEDAQSELELIRVADQRLYHAKHAGRNRIVVVSSADVAVGQI